MGKLLCEKNYGTFGVEMRAYGQKLVQFCKHTHTHTHTRVSYSSIDYSDVMTIILAHRYMLKDIVSVKFNKEIFPFWDYIGIHVCRHLSTKC